MPSATVCIIGAGFAGASCAYFLTKHGVRDVVVLEAGEQPGLYSSGLNAAMARQFVINPAIRRFAIRGTQFLYDPPSEVSGTCPTRVGHVSDTGFIRPIGSLILFDASTEYAVRHAVEAGQAEGLVSSIVRRDECEARVPLLKDADFCGAVWTPSDGVVDIHSYLTGLLHAASAAGARVELKSTVRSVRQGGEGFEVTTGTDTWRCRVIVNAAGAWADRVAQLCGASPRGLRPLRRHLFQSVPMGDVDTRWPFVWDVTHEYYFRPESGGLLLCACDEEEVKPDTGYCADPKAAELLALKFSRFCPRLSSVQIQKAWAGVRTFAPDNEFAIGWDEQVRGLYWIAGLGGHGVTCAAAVGDLAAGEIVHQCV